MYKCLPCNYENADKANYKQHCGGKKHKLKCEHAVQAVQVVQAVQAAPEVKKAPRQLNIDHYFQKLEKFEKKMEEQGQAAAVQVSAIAVEVAELKSRFDAAEDTNQLKAQLVQKNHEIDILNLKLQHEKELRAQAAQLMQPVQVVQAARSVAASQPAEPKVDIDAKRERKRIEPILETEWKKLNKLTGMDFLEYALDDNRVPSSHPNMSKEHLQFRDNKVKETVDRIVTFERDTIQEWVDRKEEIKILKNEIGNSGLCSMMSKYAAIRALVPKDHISFVACAYTSYLEKWEPSALEVPKVLVCAPKAPEPPKTIDQIMKGARAFVSDCKMQNAKTEIGHFLNFHTQPWNKSDASDHFPSEFLTWVSEHKNTHLPLKIEVKKATEEVKRDTEEVKKDTDESNTDEKISDAKRTVERFKNEQNYMGIITFLSNDEAWYKEELPPSFYKWLEAELELAEKELKRAARDAERRKTKSSESRIKSIIEAAKSHVAQLESERNFRHIIEYLQDDEREWNEEVFPDAFMNWVSKKTRLADEEYAKEA